MIEKEKAKAYDEALERAKKLHDKIDIEEIFPEPKESDDVKIKNAILNHFKKMWENCKDDVCGVHVEDAIAWLEKQYTSHTDKIKPKFKVGNWIVTPKNKVLQITSIEGISYRFNNESRYWEICCCDEQCRFWTIQDAKDGDIICYRDEISLYKYNIINCTKQETTFGGFIYYCCYDGKRFITNSFYLLTKQDEMDIHPATKEQRDLLFQKMKEAGYEWDTKKKELKKKKRKR